MKDLAFTQKAGVSAIAAPLWVELTDPLKKALPVLLYLKIF